MRSVIVATVIAVLAVCMFLANAEEARPRPTLDDFLGEADLWSPELSPSGRYLSGVRRIEGQDYIVTLDLDNPESGLKPTGVGDLYVRWSDWVTDDRFLVALTGFVNLRNGRQMSREDLKEWTEDSRAIPVSYSRLVSIDRESGAVTAMFAGSDSMNRNFYLSGVTDFLPKDPDHILMPARLHGDLDLFKVNVVDGSFERIATGTNNTYAWYTDREGEPAFRLNVNRRGTILNVYARESRDNGKIKWRKVRTVRLNESESNDAALDFQILGAGPTPTTYYISARPDGEEFAGVYLYDFEKDEIIETVRTHAGADIENAFFNSDTREFMGVYYFEDRLVIEMENQHVDNHLRGLNTYFDDEANVIPLDTNSEGDRWLVMSSGPRDPGTYHVYYLDEAYALRLGYQYNALGGKALGRAQVIEYEARDGLKLRGYLTRPEMAESDPPPPLIVMPHGGPESRDYYDFDQDVQILVSQGYQVFQPNFRGSSGYGRTFADLGRRQWGKAMQTDIDDGFDHLVGEGLAKADQACIFGYSYGGYAALAAATLTPEKYQCVIAAAGPSDLREMLKYERREEGSDSEAYAYWVEHIGDPKQDRTEIDAVSPAKLADRIVCPLLILHGKQDRVVDYKQSEIMEKALIKANKPYRLVALENSAHSYMPEEDEWIYYSEIIAFLNQHLPVD